MAATLSRHLHTLARLALGATIVLIPFRSRLVLVSRPIPPVYRDYTDVLLFASDVFLIATLILWLLSLAVEPRRLTMGPLFLTFPIVGLTGIGMIGVPFSVDPALSFYHSMRLFLLVGLYLFVLNEIKGLSEIIIPIAVQLFIQAAVGVGQTLQQHSLGLKALGELELDPVWQGVSIVWTDTARSLRAYGLSDHPNILGGCFTFALLLTAGWYVQTESKWRAPASSLFALGGLGLLLTFSRSAWLALVVGVGLMAILFLRSRETGALHHLLALVAAGLVLVTPFGWQNRGYLGMRFDMNASFTPGTPENRSISHRDTLIGATNAVFAEHPLSGVGLGTLPVALYHHFPDFPIDYQPAHLVLLDVVAETGIFGGLFYMTAMLAPWLALWFKRSRLHPSPALIGATGALMAASVIGLLDYYTWLLVPGRLWQWLVWGLWATFYHDSLPSKPDLPKGII